MDRLWEGWESEDYRRGFLAGYEQRMDETGDRTNDRDWSDFFDGATLNNIVFCRIWQSIEDRDSRMFQVDDEIEEAA